VYLVWGPQIYQFLHPQMNEREILGNFPNKRGGGGGGHRVGGSNIFYVCIQKKYWRKVYPTK
jgi:hypothetical protein